jgi:tRNA nucleotidyltransferase (CCA-adding enzyme)
MRNLLKEVLKEIKPNKNEIKNVKKICKKIFDVAKRVSSEFGFKPMFCGSVVKGTWLKPAEIDLFLLFDASVERNELERKGLEAAKKIIETLNGKWEIAYTEHPYLRGKIKEGKEIYEIDIVPCYDVLPTQIKSAVDRTPWHVRFVLENLKEKQKDEVRLLKKFCKANEIYGADLRYQGFSGYLCELLIIKFGSFEKLVREASKWYPQVVLWFEKPEENVIKMFKNNPLVFLDPVDPKRNVAAAVSPQSFFKFIKTCQDFLRKPSKQFFFPKEKPITLKQLRKKIDERKTNFIAVLFEKPKVQDDILYSQLRRCLKIMEKYLHKHEFTLIGKDFYCDATNCILLFEAEVWKLPKVRRHVGPNIFSKHAKEFLKHYNRCKARIENDMWVIEEKREFTTLKQYFEYIFSQEEKELKERGIPSYLAKSISTKFKIFEGKNFLKFVEKMPREFRVFLKKYFEKDLNIFC